MIELLQGEAAFDEPALGAAVQADVGAVAARVAVQPVRGEVGAAAGPCGGVTQGLRAGGLLGVDRAGEQRVVVGGAEQPTMGEVSEQDRPNASRSACDRA